MVLSLTALSFFINYYQLTVAIVPFLSSDELKYTFGVASINEVPLYREIYPNVVSNLDGNLQQLTVTINGRHLNLTFEPSTKSLVSPHVTTVFRNSAGGGNLSVGLKANNCHYQHRSQDVYAAISKCDGTIKGILVMNDAMYVIHPVPERHLHRFDRNIRNVSEFGLHVLYKRSVAQDDFCGIESLLSSAELTDDDNLVTEDIYATGQRLTQEGELIVELAIFVDEMLWRHFNSKYGNLASDKIQDYALTMLNNVQIMYHQPSAIPQLTFHVVRFEILTTQPQAMAPHLHDNGHAQKYLDRFCRYQRSLSSRDWDHALLLTGYDIHRGSGSRAISGIARLDGMCDPFNTCTLAEGLDFTSAFIGTHELGHSVGMRHDEPYCPSKHIMSTSLGPGKVTWSSCSLRDYHTFLQRLDARGRNCLRVSNLPQKLTVRTDLKPGQVYNADTQCYMMHGQGYRQITPRQDHYDGICYMMWCGQSTFGRIITSHPALEGTFCGPSKWCELGRCVPWPGYGIGVQKIDGQWSEWSSVSCSSCSCSDISGGVGVTISVRSCNNPSPANGGQECIGSPQRAIVCDHKCSQSTKSVNQFISEKCAEQKKLKNDGDLTGTGSQLKRYPQRACKVFCDVSTSYGSQRNYRFFGDNLPNGAPCGRNKYCLEGECLPLSCDGNALITRDVSCTAEQCKSVEKKGTGKTSDNDNWTSWSTWSYCSQTCGGGYRKRSRTCTIGVGYCSGADSESEVCDTAQCPNVPNGKDTWSEWTPWNQCSVSCGQGSQARYRRCNTAKNTLSYECQGETMEMRQCDMGTCEHDTVGLWGTWTEWSSCSTTCGPGIQTRSRYCTKEPCDGSGQSRMSCNLGACTATAQWMQWGSWTECSQQCGKGLRSRSRECPSTGGCLGSGTEQQICNEHPCASSVGRWSSWSSWGACSVTCGNGVKRRTRHCQYGSCTGRYRDSTSCNSGSCYSSTTANWGGKHESADTTSDSDGSSMKKVSDTTNSSESDSLTAVSQANDVSVDSTTAEATRSKKSNKITVHNVTEITVENSTKGAVEMDATTKKLRRFYLFTNGTLSRRDEADPILLQTLAFI